MLCHSPFTAFELTVILGAGSLGLVGRLDSFGRCIAPRDLDLPGLSVFTFRKADPQDPIIEFRCCAFGCYCLRQSEGSGEFAIGAFHTMVVVTLSFLFEPSLALERYHVVLERKFEVFAAHAGEFGLENEVVL